MIEWFKHDVNAHDDLKIRKLVRMHGIMAYGLYWYLVEILYSKDGTISEDEALDEMMLAGVEEDDCRDLMETFIDLKLFSITDGKLRSNRVDGELENAAERSRYMRKIGSRGGQAKAKRTLSEDLAHAKQIRLDKTRLDNNNIDISDEISHSPSEKGETPKTEKNPVDYERIMNLFNEICTGFPKITKLSDRRRRAIRARLNGKYSLDDIERAFRKAQASDFLKGANDHNWSADFDWIINDSNMAKILDGNYDNGKASMKGTQRTSMFDSGIAADGGDREKFKNAKTMLEIYREKQREEARRAAR